MLRNKLIANVRYKRKTLKEELRKGKRKRCFVLEIRMYSSQPKLWFHYFFTVRTCYDTIDIEIFFGKVLKVLWNTLRLNFLHIFRLQTTVSSTTGQQSI